MDGTSLANLLYAGRIGRRSVIPRRKFTPEQRIANRQAMAMRKAARERRLWDKAVERVERKKAVVRARAMRGAVKALKQREKRQKAIARCRKIVEKGRECMAKLQRYGVGV